MTTRVSLKEFYLFRGMTPDDLASVEACAERQQRAPGQLIFREGDEADAMYFVELGTVEIVKTDGPTTALEDLRSASVRRCRSQLGRYHLPSPKAGGYGCHAAPFGSVHARGWSSGRLSAAPGFFRFPHPGPPRSAVPPGIR